jgi:hypothetical protein
MPLRDSLDRVSPVFLRGPNGEKLRAGVTLVLDALVQLAEMGVKARMPDLAPEDALPLIGRDRRIRRGFIESSASYRVRLKRWLDDHRIAGSSFAVMQQVRGYMSPYTPRMRVVHTSPDGALAKWCTLNPDGTKEVHHQSPCNWDWDGQTTAWWRSWLIIYGSGTPWLQEPDYNDTSPVDAIWGSDQFTWGSTAKADEVRSIQTIVGEWTAAHQIYQNIIICWDDSKFSPTGSGAGYPDGTWGKWGKRVSGVSQPSRASFAIYWDGAS